MIDYRVRLSTIVKAISDNDYLRGLIYRFKHRVFESSDNRVRLIVVIDTIPDAETQRLAAESIGDIFAAAPFIDSIVLPEPIVSPKLLRKHSIFELSLKLSTFYEAFDETRQYYKQYGKVIE